MIEKFIQLNLEIYDSPKWRSLKWYSKLAYLRIKRNRITKEDKKIVLTYREILDEMSQPTFSKALKELLESGFIEIVQTGGLLKKKNYYALSNKWETILLNIPEKIIVARNTITEAERKEIFDRDNWQCVKCGNTKYLQIDHIFPFSKGGETKMDNLQTLCKICNSKKHNNIIKTTLR